MVYGIRTVTVDRGSTLDYSLIGRVGKMTRVAIDSIEPIRRDDLRGRSGGDGPGETIFAYGYIKQLSAKIRENDQKYAKMRENVRKCTIMRKNERKYAIDSI